MRSRAFWLEGVPRYVRVRAVRPDGFVEFDFALGEPEIFVELILPTPAFDEFCSANHVTLLGGEGTVGDGAEDSGWNWRISDATRREPG